MNLYDVIRASFPVDPTTQLMALADSRSATHDDIGRQSAVLATRIVSTGAQSGERLTVQFEKPLTAIAVCLAGDRSPGIAVCDPDKMFVAANATRRNGNRLGAISEERMRQSCRFLVDHVFDLNSTEAGHEANVKTDSVITSNTLAQLARTSTNASHA